MRRLPSSVAAAVLWLTWLAVGPAWAGDAPEASPGPRVLTDGEAAPLVENLKKVHKAKLLSDATPAFEALAGVTHPSFEPVLSRLLIHAVPEVAGRAARALGERPGPKTVAALWKGFDAPPNGKREEVRAWILEALGRLKAPLDDKRYRDAERLFQNTESAAVQEAVAAYFVAVPTDKRPCKVFALWLDEPAPANVNDPNNPGADWWKARWKLWQRTRPAAQKALAAITGQTFESSDDAKAWFAQNPKFGVRW